MLLAGVLGGSGEGPGGCSLAVVVEGAGRVPAGVLAGAPGGGWEGPGWWSGWCQLVVPGVPGNSNTLPVGSDRTAIGKTASADLDLMALCV